MNEHKLLWNGRDACKPERASRSSHNYKSLSGVIGKWRMRLPVAW